MNKLHLIQTCQRFYPIVFHQCNEFVKSCTWKIPVLLLFLLPCVACSQQSSWPLFALGSPSLHLILPGEPEAMETQIQPSMLEVMHAYYAYKYEDPQRGIWVMLLQTSYAQHIHPDFTIISDQTIRELASRGAQHITYETSSIQIEGKVGFRQQGTLDVKGEQMDFTTTILSEGANVWKVIIYERTGDAEAKQAAQLIMDSMTFKED